MRTKRLPAGASDILAILQLVMCLVMTPSFSEAQTTSENPTDKAHSACGMLPGFMTSPYFDEQVMSFIYEPGIKVLVNAPSAKDFDKSKPAMIVLYALPNGNSTDWTAGKLPAQGDDWHFHIQHIAAQTRFMRSRDTGYNLITVYLEAEKKSWGAWRRGDGGNTSSRDLRIKEFVEYMYEMFAPFNPQVVLNSHSGGGNFIFGFIDACDTIPAYIKRISFLDSDYNWDKKRYGKKLTSWLKADSENSLFVACYNDANALYEGKPFVSLKGSTWYRTHIMSDYVRKHVKRSGWMKIETDSTITHLAKDRKIQFFFRKNPEREIYHTILVERNGYIHSLFAGGSLEEKDYVFMGEHAYDGFRQDSTVLPHPFRFKPRKAGAMIGSEFAEAAASMTLQERDSLILKEIKDGNFPDFLRKQVYIKETLKDSDGNSHEVILSVLPDLLAIGSDEDFLRIPAMPGTAQLIADCFNATLPTPKLSDIVHAHSPVKMQPHPMTPDATMITVPVFVRHDSIVEARRRDLDPEHLDMVAGHKKDIVISNRIANEPTRVFIYGWHYPDGKAIQDLCGVHVYTWVDYSHGIRLVSDEVLVDGKLRSIKDLLKDPVLYALLSNETGPMEMTEYRTDPAD